MRFQNSRTPGEQCIVDKFCFARKASFAERLDTSAPIVVCEAANIFCNTTTVVKVVRLEIDYATFRGAQPGIGVRLNLLDFLELLYILGSRVPDTEKIDGYHEEEGK